MEFVKFMIGAGINILWIFFGFAVFFAIAGKRGRQVIRLLIATVRRVIILVCAKVSEWVNRKIEEKEGTPEEDEPEPEIQKIEARII